MTTMWEGTDKLGITAKCEYDGKTYIVTVSRGEKKLTEMVPCSFTPTFGMDVIDMAETEKVADKMATVIERGGV